MNIAEVLFGIKEGGCGRSDRGFERQNLFSAPSSLLMNFLQDILESDRPLRINQAAHEVLSGHLKRILSSDSPKAPPTSLPVLMVSQIELPSSTIDRLEGEGRSTTEIRRNFVLLKSLSLKLWRLSQQIGVLSNSNRLLDNKRRELGRSSVEMD